jgi:PD-(D/E)XK endonuclease
MKNRKNLVCRIKGTRERGAWAELYFMVLAMSQGLKVSSPYGGFAPYDVGVDDGSGPILRVQVKCTLYQCSTGSYCMSINQKDGVRGRRGYAPGTVDFFAIYIIPVDDWYIIPYAVIGDRDANVFFKPGMKKQKYGEYREAWHLLVQATKRKDEGLIDIQACCSEEVERGEEINPVTPLSAIRQMFRRDIWGSEGAEVTMRGRKCSSP